MKFFRLKYCALRRSVFTLARQLKSSELGTGKYGLLLRNPTVCHWLFA